MGAKINPILLEIPGELGTERLLLRTPRPGDGALVWPSVRDSLAELKQWMPWAHDAYGPDDAEEWCRKSAAHFHLREQLQFLVLDRETGHHLGNVGMFKFNWAVPSCEIGYWLHTGHTGKGYMTEAVRGMTRMAMEVLQAARVQILADDRNMRSWKVAERCGYTLEGVFRFDSRAPDGSLRNTRVYSRIVER